MHPPGKRSMDINININININKTVSNLAGIHGGPPLRGICTLKPNAQTRDDTLQHPNYENCHKLTTCTNACYQQSSTLAPMASHVA